MQQYNKFNTKLLEIPSFCLIIGRQNMGKSFLMKQILDINKTIGYIFDNDVNFDDIKNIITRSVNDHITIVIDGYSSSYLVELFNNNTIKYLMNNGKKLNISLIITSTFPNCMFNHTLKFFDYIFFAEDWSPYIKRKIYETYFNDIIDNLKTFDNIFTCLAIKYQYMILSMNDNNITYYGEKLSTDVESSYQMELYKNKNNSTPVSVSIEVYKMNKIINDIRSKLLTLTFKINKLTY